MFFLAVSETSGSRMLTCPCDDDRRQITGAFRGDLVSVGKMRLFGRGVTGNVLLGTMILASLLFVLGLLWTHHHISDHRDEEENSFLSSRFDLPRVRGGLQMLSKHWRGTGETEARPRGISTGFSRSTGGAAEGEKSGYGQVFSITIYELPRCQGQNLVFTSDSSEAKCKHCVDICGKKWTSGVDATVQSYRVSGGDQAVVSLYSNCAGTYYYADPGFVNFAVPGNCVDVLDGDNIEHFKFNFDLGDRATGRDPPPDTPQDFKSTLQWYVGY